MDFHNSFTTDSQGNSM